MNIVVRCARCRIFHHNDNLIRLLYSSAARIAVKITNMQYVLYIRIIWLKNVLIKWKFRYERTRNVIFFLKLINWILLLKLFSVYYTIHMCVRSSSCEHITSFFFFFATVLIKKYVWSHVRARLFHRYTMKLLFSLNRAIEASQKKNVRQEVTFYYISLYEKFCD